MYGESAARNIEMFILIFTPEMVASADGQVGGCRRVNSERWRYSL